MGQLYAGINDGSTTFLRSRRGFVPVRTLTDHRSVVVHFAPYYTTHCGLTVLCVLRYLDVFQRQRVNVIFIWSQARYDFLTRNVLFLKN